MEQTKEKIKVKFKQKYLIKTEKAFLTQRIIDETDLIPHSKISTLHVIEQIIGEIMDKLKIKPTIYLFGKECSQQRDVGFFSNESKGYRYSGKLMASQSLSDNMQQLLLYINNLYGSQYNGILINRYNTGEEYIGAHSDDESGLDKSGVVALSWGITRKFRIRDKKTKKIHMDIPLDHLSIINMGGEFQREFTHEVPAEKKVKGMRISLTFRRHMD
jgi:alkylated DNA repair dioxygenase AlkB